MDWNLLYRGPASLYRDHISQQDFPRNVAVPVDTATKIRLTEGTRRPLYKDVWDSEPYVEPEPEEDSDDAQPEGQSADGDGQPEPVSEVDAEPSAAEPEVAPEGDDTAESEHQE